MCKNLTPTHSPPAALTHSLARKSELDALPFHEVLEMGVELHAVLLADDGCGIGCFDGVGVAIPGNHLCPYHVHNGIEQAIVEHPAREFQARRWLRGRRLQI